MIIVVDYGSGNLRSVTKSLEIVGGRVRISSDPADISRAERLVLPGVGAFGDCRANLDARGLTEPVLEHLRTGRPFLGICVGMQLLFTAGEEFGYHPGLDLIPGRVVPFSRAMTDATDPERHLKVPHMGWNKVHQEQNHPLWVGIPDNSHFYFVHSFHGQVTHATDVAGSSFHGVGFTAAVAKENLFATQFHPEKSQQHGLRLLHNFLKWST
ncbi:MAG: imidazole glycerol phosphate synthase subunit HisH [Magnetococcales bacterium]|nr:imidazole glycerol phosphate synthase subunit HisH [Magnetococcales bacterium]MBF0321963.1 imidazole glycerol phosphate synthase subunit HisH [Magnetococcales bacterium]